jgi:hypothetical protein
MRFSDDRLSQFPNLSAGRVAVAFVCSCGVRVFASAVLDTASETQ